MGFVNDYFCNDVSVEDRFKQPFGDTISRLICPSPAYRYQWSNVVHLVLNLYYVFMNREVICTSAGIELMPDDVPGYTIPAIVTTYKTGLHKFIVSIYGNFHHELVHIYNNKVVKSQPFMCTNDMEDYVLSVIKMTKLLDMKKRKLYRGAKYGD